MSGLSVSRALCSVVFWRSLSRPNATLLPMKGFSTDPSDRRACCVTVTADLEEFVEMHRSHGSLKGDSGDLTPNGYLLTVACACGVTFHRWVTPHDAAEDLAALARGN
jgi:hypothetical protein